MVRIIGVLLIVVGLVALATGGLTYTRREKVVDIGPIEATAEKRDRIPLAATARRRGARRRRRAARRRSAKEELMRR